MSEIAFAPYFVRSMQCLVKVGIEGLKEINSNAPIEDQKPVHELREALVESFISILNGIKSPQDNAGLEVQMTNDLNEQIKTMFFYLEKLLTLSDLRVDAEMAKQIIDLYSDIIILQVDDQRAGLTDAEARAALAFTQTVRDSHLHQHIEEKLAPYKDQIDALDQGEAIMRFTNIVQ